MQKNEQLNDFLWDKRVTARHVADGKLTQAELQSHLNALGDQEDQCDDIGPSIYAEEEKPKLALHHEIMEQE